ncbi:MAG: hypothetical protein NVSMB27_00640 [Ktedonobacteraceae bacterium]
MPIRRRFAGHIVLLAALCLLIGFNALMTHITQASSPPWHKSAKDTLQILPKKLASQSSVPATTTSIYETTTDAVQMDNQGCRAAYGAPGLIILDWGQPVYFGNGTYGTYDFGGNDDTDTAILHAVANFAQGVWDCRTGSTNIALGIGESNYYSDHAIPLTTAAWYADGQQWGLLVNRVQSFLTTNRYTVVGANGAGDLEVEWSDFTLTSSLVNGYNSVTSHVYFDFGDDSPGWWSNEQVWYVAYGARDNLPLPEIYYNGDAIYDWESLDVWACRYEGGPIYFKGIMSEYVTGTNSPAQAFTDLYNAEASNSCTARDLPGMIFSTEIYHTVQM